MIVGYEEQRTHELKINCSLSFDYVNMWLHDSKLSKSHFMHKGKTSFVFWKAGAQLFLQRKSHLQWFCGGDDWAITDVHANFVLPSWPSSVCKWLGFSFSFDKLMKLQKQRYEVGHWRAIASGHQHGTICSSISHWVLVMAQHLIKYQAKFNT